MYLARKFVHVRLGRIVHMHLLPSETKSNSDIWSFVEIAHIAFSAEVPIGAFSQSR